MGLFQPSSLVLPVYPEESRGAIGDARPPSTESAAADKPVLPGTVKASLLRPQKQAPGSRTMPGLPVYPERSRRASPAGPEPRRRACPAGPVHPACPHAKRRNCSPGACPERDSGEPHRGERHRGASTLAGPALTFELSPQPAGSRLREESTPRTGSAQPERTLRADKNKSVRAAREVGARKFALSNPNTFELARHLFWRAWPPSLWREPASPIFGGPGRPLSGRSLSRRSLAGDTSTGNENKPLTAISNRNTNERRKLATLSEPTTSNFLIATKTHFSEEKAKSEEKTNPVTGGAS